MKPRQHLKLLLQCLLVWAGFWVAGLPAYYQQYSLIALGVGCTVLSVGISLIAIVVLRRARPEIRLSRAIWFSVYYTVPFAILDTWYCAVYLGHGAEYLQKYWYLTLFYVTPWLTFVPTALLLGGAGRSQMASLGPMTR